MAERIIADAGALIGLARIGSLSLVEVVFHEVILPRQVFEETCRDLALPGATAIRSAVDGGRLSVVEASREESVTVPPGLGAGERAAIELARQCRLGVLMDDLPGRKAAKRLKIPVLGTGGLLLLAKQREHLKEIRPLIDRLRETGYRLSTDLVRDLLKRANED